MFYKILNAHIIITTNEGGKGEPLPPDPDHQTYGQEK